MFDSVVKESCFKHLQDVIARSVCDVHSATLSQPTSIPAHLFALKWRLKSSEDKVVSQQERKALLCFVAGNWGGKCQNGNFSYLPTNPPQLIDCKWHKPNNFLTAA